MLIAAVDVAYHEDRAFVGAIVMAGRDVVESVSLEYRLAVADYQPGEFARREAPCALEALGKLQSVPSILLVDGQGRAHPRRYGLACLLGEKLGWPTVGVAKNLLVGEHGPLDTTRGAQAPILFENETVGAAVRTREGVKPVYVSVGFDMELEQAVETVLSSSRYRIPDPLRAAHGVSVEARRVATS